VMVIITMLSGQ